MLLVPRKLKQSTVMITYYYLNFQNGKRIYTKTERANRPPLHTYLVFPSNHEEVAGFLSAFITDTTEYLGKRSEDDYQVVDLTPTFNLPLETFMSDQAAVGRFQWIRHDEDPLLRM